MKVYVLDDNGSEVTYVPQGTPVIDYKVSEAECILVQYGAKIPAIKSYRSRTGLGLKESKDAVESATRNVPMLENYYQRAQEWEAKYYRLVQATRDVIRDLQSVIPEY